MMEIEKVPGEQVSVVYNGMEALREPEPEGVARLRQEFGLKNEPVCLMLARLHEEKGHSVLFEQSRITRRLGGFFYSAVTVRIASGERNSSAGPPKHRALGKAG